jgi:V/A-type H+-transporting ATPase subunit B
LRRLVAIIGEAALSEQDRRYLAFAAQFEEEFIQQGAINRPLEETFDRAWQLLGRFPAQELKRIQSHFIEEYYPGPRETEQDGTG